MVVHLPDEHQTTIDAAVATWKATLPAATGDEDAGPGKGDGKGAAPAVAAGARKKRRREDTVSRKVKTDANGQREADVRLFALLTIICAAIEAKTISLREGALLNPFTAITCDEAVVQIKKFTYATVGSLVVSVKTMKQKGQTFGPITIQWRFRSQALLLSDLLLQMIQTEAAPEGQRPQYAFRPHVARWGQLVQQL